MGPNRAVLSKADLKSGCQFYSVGHRRKFQTGHGIIFAIFKVVGLSIMWFGKAVIYSWLFGRSILRGKKSYRGRPRIRVFLSFSVF